MACTQKWAAWTTLVTLKTQSTTTRNTDMFIAPVHVNSNMNNHQIEASVANVAIITIQVALKFVNM